MIELKKKKKRVLDIPVIDASIENTDVLLSRFSHFTVPESLNQVSNKTEKKSY